MRLTRCFGAGAMLLCGLLVAPPALAADFSDPTWPCIQRKVERLSVGLMWPHPITETELPERTAIAVGELADALALRRLQEEELRPLVADFASEHGNDRDLLGRVFQAAFDALARRRTRIIGGIGEFSLEQIALSERIDGARTEMERLMAADKPDFDRVDALEEQIDWDERIYIDRQRSLTYLCETPVLLEKRLYSIAQMLLAADE